MKLYTKRYGRASGRDSADEFVADTMDGEKEARLFGNGFEFLAEANDVGVHRACGGVIVVAPDFIEETVAGERLTGMAEKMFEQLEFLGGKFHGFAGANHLIAAQVHFDVGEGVAV